MAVGVGVGGGGRPPGSYITVSQPNNVVHRGRRTGVLKSMYFAKHIKFYCRMELILLVGYEW